ncbi:MAG: hypothetical protein AAGK79_13380 [Pseudomonadota bacterium]
MTYTPTIYDWRTSCAPFDQMFRAGGQSIAGGLTTGGARTESPEPGGRAELFWSFRRFGTTQQNRDASWLASRMLNGNVLRVPLVIGVQLVPETDLTPPADLGLTWANDKPWSNKKNWRWNPRVAVTVAALKGATSLTVDMSDFGEVLQIGHVIGFTVDGYEFAHMVMDVEYTDAGAATITVEPPLRRAVTTDDTMQFRPKMLVVCRNAREVGTQFQRGLHMQFAAAQFVEALV